MKKESAALSKSGPGRSLVGSCRKNPLKNYQTFFFPSDGKNFLLNLQGSLVVSLEESTQLKQLTASLSDRVPSRSKNP